MKEIYIRRKEKKKESIFTLIALLPVLKSNVRPSALVWMQTKPNPYEENKRMINSQKKKRKRRTKLNKQKEKKEKDYQEA